MHPMIKLLCALLIIKCSGEKTPSKLQQNQGPWLQPLISFEELWEQKRDVTVHWPHPISKTLQSLDIVHLEIPIDQVVEIRTRQYLAVKYPGRVDELSWLQPRAVVLHSMALGNLKTALEDSGFLHNGILWGSFLRHNKAPLGCHFMVGEDGTIYALTPGKSERYIHIEADYANPKYFFTRRHISQINPWAIGIENIVPAVENVFELPDYFKQKAFENVSPAQIKANAKLIAWLRHHHPQLDLLYSHHQFSDAGFLAANARKLGTPIGRVPKKQVRWDVGWDVLSQVQIELEEYGVFVSTDPRIAPYKPLKPLFPTNRK